MTCEACQQIKALARAMGQPQATIDRSYSWYCLCPPGKTWTYDDIPAPRRENPIKTKVIEFANGSRIKAFTHDPRLINRMADTKDHLWRFYE